MHAFFPPGIGRLGTILAFGLALWAAAGTGQAMADDPCGCGANDGCDAGLLGRLRAVATLPVVCQHRRDGDAAIISRAWPALPIRAPDRTRVALSQQDLDEPFQSGVRMLVGHTFDDSPYQVEASYFWLSPWDTSAQAIDPTGSLFSPFTNFGSSRHNTASITTAWSRSTRSRDWRAGRSI